MGRRVRKFDGAFGPEGCGIARRAMLIKSALRDLLSVSYGMKSILRIGSLRSPPPSGCAGLLHGKACHTILRSLRFLTNRVPLPPLFRGQNKTTRNTLFINGSTVSTGYSATVHILHRMCKLVKVSPKPAHKRAFLLIDQPNCGGGKGTGFIGEPRDPRIQ